MADQQDLLEQRRVALGEHIRAVCERRWGTEAEAVRNLPVARETLRRLFQGANSSPKTHRAIERNFGWRTGSIRHYLQSGGELPGMRASEDDEPEIFIIDRSTITREEVKTLLWSVTSAHTGIERLREVRKLEDEIMSELD